MIKCLAIDDEPLALKQLETYIDKVPFLELSGCCQSAIEAHAIMRSTTIDAIFIDINMPDLNGLDFVRSLTSPPLVVFTTAYAEYAVDGFKVDAVDYLLKPFGLEDFKRAANKLKTRHEAQNLTSVSAPDTDNAMFLKSEHRIVRVDIDHIRYIEVMSEYLKIHMDKESMAKPLIVLLSMKKLEERLPKDSFMRIHRSYIVNLKKIIEVNKNRVILDADTYLPLGDLYRDQFNAYLESKFIGK